MIEWGLLITLLLLALTDVIIFYLLWRLFLLDTYTTATLELLAKAIDKLKTEDKINDIDA